MKGQFLHGHNKSQNGPGEQALSRASGQPLRKHLCCYVGKRHYAHYRLTYTFICNAFVFLDVLPAFVLIQDSHSEMCRAIYEDSRMDS